MKPAEMLKKKVRFQKRISVCFSSLVSDPEECVDAWMDGWMDGFTDFSFAGFFDEFSLYPTVAVIRPPIGPVYDG